MFPTVNEDVRPVETEQFPLKLSVYQGGNIFNPLFLEG